MTENQITLPVSNEIHAKNKNSDNEINHILQNIEKDMKGKTHFDEPHITKKAIAHAVSDQNIVLHFLINKICQVEKMFQAKLEQSINDLRQEIMEKVHILNQKLVERMDEERAIVQKEIQRLDTDIENVRKEQEKSLEDIRNQLQAHSTSLAIVETDVKGLKDGVADLIFEVKNLPQTIVISSDQVIINGDEKITDIINSHSGRIEILQDNTTEMQSTIEIHDIVVKRVENYNEEEAVKTRQEVNDLLEWQESQKSVDLTVIRDTQESHQFLIETLQQDMINTVSPDDVDSKIKTNFNEIIIHLQKALSSIERDEADFKAVTANLNKMYETIKDSKVDRSELVDLRRQFIDNKIESISPSGGSNLSNSINNNDLEMLLSQYITKDALMQLLENKADISITTRLDRTDGIMEGIEKAMSDLLGSSFHDVEKSVIEKYNKGVNTASSNEERFKKQPLRALDQFRSVLPVIEKKIMFEGDDGKSYVGGRYVGNDEKEIRLMPKKN